MNNPFYLFIFYLSNTDLTKITKKIHQKTCFTAKLTSGHHMTVKIISFWYRNIAKSEIFVSDKSKERIIIITVCEKYLCTERYVYLYPFHNHSSLLKI